MKTTAGTMLLAAWLTATAPLWAAEPTLRDTLRGHKERVVVVAFSPDGKYLASRGGDSTTRLWDLAAGTGKKVGEDNWLPAPLAFSPEGKTLVLSGATVGAMQVCDLAGGKNVTVKNDPSGAAAFSPDGKIAVQEDGKGGARLRELTTAFDPATGKNAVALPGAVVAYRGTPQPAVAFSPDGASLALKDKDGNVMLWDAASGKNTATLPQSAGSWFAFGPDGKTLAAECAAQKDQFLALKDPSIKLFDAATGKETAALAVTPNDPPFRSVVFSPDGKTLASGSVYSVKVWGAAKGKSIAVLQRPAATIIPPVVFSPDGKTLAAACTDQTGKLWNVASGKITATLKDCICVPAFSPDGATLAAGGEGGTIQLWAIPAAKPAGK